MTELIYAFIGLAGGGIGSVLTYLATQKKADLDSLTLLINTLKDDNEKLRQREELNRAEIQKISTEISELRQTVMLLESAHQDLPIPMWLKDTKGVMLSLNSAYEDEFLFPRGLTRSDYIGKRDVDVWPKEVAAEFMTHDSKVLRSGKIFHGCETVLIGETPSKWRIIKYPRYSGDIKIGIAGIAIPPDNIDVDYVD